MYLEGVSEAHALGQAVLAALKRFDIRSTPDNYALWYEYHAGYSPSLKRTIDTMIANAVTFDEPTLRDLHMTFFSSIKEEQAIRETSLRIQERLNHVIKLNAQAGTNAQDFGATLNAMVTSELGTSIGNLSEMIHQLVLETRRVAGQSTYVGMRLRESGDQIERLEQNLENAIREATTDGLTGVANRKSFDSSLRKLAGDAMNSGEDLSLLMIDIDRFKQVNDTLGHQAGDAVLQHLAQVIKQTIRGEDQVARYGGEEFAAILPRTNETDAAAVGENIRQALRRSRVEVDCLCMRTTVSIGVACYEPGEPLSAWIKRADTALYQAKNEGRDCVRVCGGVLA